jgi:hypothetical protein
MVSSSSSSELKSSQLVYPLYSLLKLGGEDEERKEDDEGGGYIFVYGRRCSCGGMVVVSSFQRKSLAGGLHLQWVKLAGYGWGFQTFFTELHPENEREAVAAAKRRAERGSREASSSRQMRFGGGRRAQITLEFNLTPDVSLRLTCRSP